MLDRFARKLARRSAGSGAARARQRLRARGVNVSLADVNYAALVAAFTGEPPTRESIERAAVATGIDAMTRETLAGAGPVVQELDIDVVLEMLAVSDVPTLRRRCEELPWKEFCEARDFAVMLVEFARAFLQPAAHQGAPEALGLKELALHSDLMTAICALLVVPWFSKYSRARRRVADANLPRSRSLSCSEELADSHSRGGAQGAAYRDPRVPRPARTRGTRAGPGRLASVGAGPP